MEKKSEITVGGEPIAGTLNGRPVSDLGAALADEIEKNAVISPEHAAALRQIRGEPEPIPEGALYHVRAYSETGEPASDALLDKLLGGGTATNLAAPMTHAEAVTMCLDVNKKLEDAGATVWLGVFGVDEAGEAS